MAPARVINPLLLCLCFSQMTASTFANRNSKITENTWMNLSSSFTFPVSSLLCYTACAMKDIFLRLWCVLVIFVILLGDKVVPVSSH